MPEDTISGMTLYLGLRMDWAAVVGIIAIVVTVFNGIIGYWVKQVSNQQTALTSSQQELEKDLAAFEVKVAEHYISKDSYHRDIDDIKKMLGKIFDKLDQKADRI